VVKDTFGLLDKFYEDIEILDKYGKVVSLT